jgi:hypothetical protein
LYRLIYAVPVELLNGKKTGANINSWHQYSGTLNACYLGGGGLVDRDAVLVLVQNQDEQSSSMRKTLEHFQ